MVDEKSRSKVLEAVVKIASEAVRLKRRAVIRDFRRAVVHAVYIKRLGKAERGLADVLAPMFRRQVESMAGRLASMASLEGLAAAVGVIPGRGAERPSDGLLGASERIVGASKAGRPASDVAANLAAQVFDPLEWRDETVDLALPVLAVGMARAARAVAGEMKVELKRGGSGLVKQVVVGTGRSTASRWLNDHPGDVEKLEEMLAGTDLPIGVLTELPESMKRDIATHLTESFNEPYWADVHKATAGDAERFLRQGLNEGWSIDRMARAMAAGNFRGDTGRYARMRAERIARTECLPGGTVVDGARVVAAYRRWYSGPFVEVVTEAGRKLSGTPNHPVLTLCGWVGLGDLQESDDLVCYSRGVKSSGSSGDVHVEKPPPTISDIFDSLSAVGVFERRLTTNPDFHGDGTDGEVDVFTADGELSYGCFVPVEQGGIEKVLTEPDLGEFLLIAQCNPFPRGVGELGGLCVAADRAAVPDDEFVDASKVDSEGFCDAVARLPVSVSGEDGVDVGSELSVGTVASGEKQPSGFFVTPSGDAGPFASPQNGASVASELSGDLDAAHAGQIEIDHPLTIRRIESWSGHVYNLTTRDGYFSIAGGVYTGNSGHALNAARTISMESLKADLPPEVSEFMRRSWLSVLGNTTRDAHANLDGVPEDENGEWNLAGVQVRWPSDTNLPVGQRVNCQCSITMEMGMRSDDANRLIEEYGERVEATEAERAKPRLLGPEPKLDVEVYHGTTEEAAKSIFKQGLKKDEYQDAVYSAEKLEDALLYARSRTLDWAKLQGMRDVRQLDDLPVSVVVFNKKSFPEGDGSRYHGFRYRGDIPASEIKRVDIYRYSDVDPYGKHPPKKGPMKVIKGDGRSDEFYLALSLPDILNQKETEEQ